MSCFIGDTRRRLLLAQGRNHEEIEVQDWNRRPSTVALVLWHSGVGYSRKTLLSRPRKPDRGRTRP
jgi:hypothetical protein